MSNNNKIRECLIGYTKNDFEQIFEEVIAPLYLFQCQQSENILPKYKIVNRVTGDENYFTDSIKKIIDSY